MVVTVLLFVCAAIYLNWSYNNSWGKANTAMVEAEDAAMAAAQFKLDNLTAFVDYNGLQIDGPIKEVMCSEPIAAKFEAFGWNVYEICGNDVEEIKDALEKAKTVTGKPTMIIGKTFKGKGVSFMENQVGWHGKAPNQEQRDQAIAELDEYLKGLEA